MKKIVISSILSVYLIVFYSFLGGLIFFILRHNIPTLYEALFAEYISNYKNYDVIFNSISFLLIPIFVLYQYIFDTEYARLKSSIDDLIRSNKDMLSDDELTRYQTKMGYNSIFLVAIAYLGFINIVFWFTEFNDYREFGLINIILESIIIVYTRYKFNCLKSIHFDYSDICPSVDLEYKQKFPIIRVFFTLLSLIIVALGCKFIHFNLPMGY